MGQPGEFAIRGGYLRAYQRNGLTDFTGVYNANPGIVITTNRNQAQGQPRPGGRLTPGALQGFGQPRCAELP